MKYTLITPEGKKTVMPYTQPTLKELQDAVGGYVERVRLKGNAMMYVNEDGMSLDLPLNRWVSHLWPGGILGNALIATPKGWKGSI